MKLLKHLILLTIFAFSSLGFAQKVKVKNGEILVDKKLVAKIVKNKEGDRFESVVHNLEDKPVLEFNKFRYTIGPENNIKVFEWVEMKQPEKDKINEINVVDLTFSLNYEKLVMLFLTKKLNFFNSEGINYDVIDSFFSTDTESEDKGRYQKYLEEQKGNEALVKEIQPFLKKDLETIVKGGSEGTEIIGSLEAPEEYNSREANFVKIYDLDNNLIASSTIPYLLLSPVEVKFIDGSTTNYKSDYSFKKSSEKLSFLNELIEKVVSKGYSLSNQLTDIKQNKKEEIYNNYQKAKDNSINIYDQFGYAVNDKGERFEGKITALFEEIKNPNDIISNNLSNLGSSGIGSSVKVIYKNEKGKDKVKTIDAKKKAHFCVKSENGSEVCYYSIYIEGGPLINDSDSPLALVSSKGNFLKEIYKEGDFIVYQYDSTLRYFLKLNNKEKAFNFDFSSFTKKERKADKLKKYLGGCDYTDKYEYSEEAFTKLETIKELIKYYNTSCK